MDILETIKQSLRIDGNEEDKYLNVLINGAIDFLSEAGVPASDKNLYKVVISQIVIDWYTNREENHKTPPGIVGIINKLRYSADVGDTSGGEVSKNEA